MKKQKSKGGLINMGLINPLPLLKLARENDFAIPAFNIHTMEMIQAVAEEAAEMRTPVIMQTSPGTIRHMVIPFIVANVKTATEKHGIPIALHLDHCSDYDIVIKCIQAGYTSVMVDGSMLPYEENVNLVKEVVKVAKAADIAVEGEIGRIGGTEDNISVDEREASLTKPEEAKKFTADTGINSLAVAIGTAHGVYKGEPKLDFKRLEEIENEINVPLVLHGASGVPEASVKKAIKIGMTKINIATDLKIPMAEAIKKYFAENPKGSDPRKYLGLGKTAVKKVLKEKIKLCGVEGLLDNMELKL